MAVPPFATKASRTFDWIASFRGTVFLAGCALLAMAFLTFPDPRVQDHPWMAPIIAAFCGTGGGVGVSVLWKRPAHWHKVIPGICLIVVASLRASLFVFTSIRGGGFGITLTIVPVVTMVFPFLLGVGIWRGAYQLPASPRPGRLDGE